MKGGYVGIIGTAIGVVIGDTRSLDYGSFRVTRTYMVPLKADRATGGGGGLLQIVMSLLGSSCSAGRYMIFPLFWGHNTLDQFPHRAEVFS